MVKVEENPDTVETHDIVKNRSIIMNVLEQSDWSFWTEYLDKDIFRGVITKRETHLVKSKWPFIKQKEYSRTSWMGRITFELSTMSIYLTGNEADLKDIAQKLEDVGYNVTIWV